MYLTNYRILDKDNKVLFRNNNTSCFAEFTYSTFNDKIQGYITNSNRKMEIFACIKDVPSSKELINFWIKELNKWGLSVNSGEVDITKNNRAEYPSKCIAAPNYVWTIDFNKYTSKAQVKFACHLVRYLFEMEHYQYIEKIKELKDKNKSLSSFKLFQYISSIFRPTSYGHIVLYSGNIYNLSPLSELYKLYDIWKDQKYTNEEMLSFTIILTIQTNLSPKNLQDTFKMSYNQYKDFIKQYKK